MYKEPKYVLYVLDMSHFFEEPVRSEEYANSKDAITSAKKKIWNSLESKTPEGFADWFSFGRNVWIRSENGAPQVKFSGTEYAKKVCGVD